MKFPRGSGVVFAAVALALAFGPAIGKHIQHATDPRVFNDDVRQQIFPFFRYTGDGIASEDISANYQLDLMPVGFKLLYRVLLPVVDPEQVSKALPYVLVFIMLLGLTMAARRLGGAALVLAVLALSLQAPAFFERIMGGMPRSFAFPLIALGLWFLVTGKVRALAILAAVAQAFYSVAGCVLIIMLGVLLFIVPRSDRGQAKEWTLCRRISVFVLVGALAGALIVPVWQATRPWGRLLGPGDASEYPEIGPNGRYAKEDMLPLDRKPFPDLFGEIRRQAEKAIRGAGTPFVQSVRSLAANREIAVADVLLILLAAGLIPLAAWKDSARRGLALPLAGIGAYVIARVLAPYLYVPQRYVAYTLPLFVVVFLPLSGGAIARLLFPKRWATRTRVVGIGLTVGAVLLLLGGRGDPMAGYTIVIDPNTRIYQFIHELPKNALIAGWPGGSIDNVPYVCRRSAFLTSENHMAFHERYVLEMRRRTRALMAALFSSDQQELKELRDNFGVTHLIVNAEDFSEPPSYLAPFGMEVKQIWQEGTKRGFFVEAILAKATVFSEGTLSVLDLSRI